MLFLTTDQRLEFLVPARAFQEQSADEQSIFGPTHGGQIRDQDAQRRRQPTRLLCY